jgi:hypothetical protein
MGPCIAMHPSLVYGNTSEQTGTHKALLISRAFATRKSETTLAARKNSKNLPEIF